MDRTPILALDHLVVAARTLEEGARWLEARGVATVPGGKHLLMATHNRLARLGDDVYLEIIATDPDAPLPGRARWFGLDSPAMRARLQAGPALIHWVARTDDIAAAGAIAPEAAGEVLELARGEYRWRIVVPVTGLLPAQGAFPTLIQWQGESHPSSALPDSGCRVESVTVRCRDAARRLQRLRRLGLAQDSPVVYVESESTRISAVLCTVRGVVLLPEAGPLE